MINMIQSTEAEFVQENLQELHQLEQKHRGTPCESRLTMLKFKKEHPLYTPAEIGARIGRSERSVQRWWETYRKEGLDALLHVGRKGRPRRIEHHELHALRRKVQEDGFSELK